MAQSGIQIGDLAKRAGVSVDTVRFYERRRLLERAARTGGGFRLFTSETVERIRFIREAQEIGLSLDEIKELLADGGGADRCRHVRDLLATKLEEIDGRIKAMRSFRKTLANHLAACEKELRVQGKAAQCPVIIEIERPGRKSKVTRGTKQRKRKR